MTIPHSPSKLREKSPLAPCTSHSHPNQQVRSRGVAVSFVTAYCVFLACFQILTELGFVDRFCVENWVAEMTHESERA